MRWRTPRRGADVPQNGGGKGWVTDPTTGEKIMPELWTQLLEWLVTFPRDPATQRDWAEQNSIHEDSLRRIKRDSRFQEAWERAAATTNASVEKVQDVVAAIHLAAKAGDMKAAALYLQYVDKFTPKRRVVLDDERDLADLSREELAAELAAEAERLVG